MTERQALKNLVEVLNKYLDPDEPKYEWEEGVVKALRDAEKVLNKGS